MKIIDKFQIGKSNIPLYIFVVAVFDLPRMVIEILDLPMRYYFGGNPPLLIPVLLVVLFLNVILLYKKFRKILPVDSIDVLFLVTLTIWGILYVYHLGYFGGGWKSWNNAYLITTNIWLFLSLYVLKSYSYFQDVRFRLVDVTINVVTWFSFFFLVLALIDFVVILPIHEKLQSNNGLAMKSVFCLLLAFFYGRSRKNSSLIVILFIHTFIIFYSHSRGALLVLIMLVAYQVYIQAIPFRIKSLTNSFVVVFSFTFGLVFFNDFLLYLDAALFPFDIYGEAYVRWDLEGEGAEGLSDKLTSAVSRIQSNVLLFREFLSQPLFGVGYQNSMDVRSFGFISHTYYLFPLSSYGIIGSLTYFFMAFLIFKKGYKYNKESTIAAAIFLMMFFLFTNDMVTWLAVMIFLLVTKNPCNNFDENFLPRKIIHAIKNNLNITKLKEIVFLK